MKTAALHIAQGTGAGLLLWTGCWGLYWLRGSARHGWPTELAWDRQTAQALWWTWVFAPALLVLGW